MSTLHPQGQGQTRHTYNRAQRGSKGSGLPLNRAPGPWEEEGWVEAPGEAGQVNLGQLVPQDDQLAPAPAVMSAMGGERLVGQP